MNWVWKGLAAFWFLIALVAVLILFDILPRPGFLPKESGAREAARADGFEAFEGIAFAREFSERLQTFDARTFKVSQVATAFLLDDDNRAKRIAEVERLEDKIVRSQVAQRGRLATLVKLPGSEERFRADVDVELFERENARSDFQTRLEFELERTDRTAQNPWGFRVRNMKQEVLASPTPGTSENTAPVFFLRPGVATLVRLPCTIENVELPKGTSVRVKLTTFDISELQIKTDQMLGAEQAIRAVCRDRTFTLKVAPEIQSGSPLVVFKSLTLANAIPMATAGDALKTRKRKKSGIEKSIEEQLGFIVEE